ncbi:MAG: C45 family autoproteolytic acyltransferase/hydrolase [Lachnospiraceae bacterium]
MKRKWWLLIPVVLLVVVVVFLAGAWSMFGTQVKAAGTVTKLEDRLYSLEYEGDYGFAEFLEQGGASSDEKMAEYIIAFLSHGFYSTEVSETEKSYGCSALSAVNESSDAVFGRNYDWDDCSAMIVHTKPDGAYESVSTVCLDFLGFEEGWKPEGMMNQMMALAAVYLPLDGMNEKGLCVADLMAGDKQETHQDTDKPDLTTVSAIRLLLDYAATVDEAVELLSQYDMNSSIGSAHHFAISDAQGNAVVVEWIDNEMFVTETSAVTNHYLTPGSKFGIGSEESHARYEKLMHARELSNGVLSEEAMRDTLQQNSYEGETQWSIVYNQDALTIDFYWQRQYDSPISFSVQ